MRFYLQELWFARDSFVSRACFVQYHPPQQLHVSCHESIAATPALPVQPGCARALFQIAFLYSSNTTRLRQYSSPLAHAIQCMQVLQHCSEQYRPMRMVTFDCGLRNSLPLSWMYKWLSGPSPAAHFLEAITASSRPPLVCLQPPSRTCTASGSHLRPSVWDHVPLLPDLI